MWVPPGPQKTVTPGMRARRESRAWLGPDPREPGDRARTGIPQKISAGAITREFDIRDDHQEPSTGTPAPLILMKSRASAWWGAHDLVKRASQAPLSHTVMADTRPPIFQAALEDRGEGLKSAQGRVVVLVHTNWEKHLILYCFA